MVTGSATVKIVAIVLVIVGVLVLLTVFGMFFMHDWKTGGSGVSRLLSSIVGIRRGIMGM